LVVDIDWDYLSKLEVLVCCDGEERPEGGHLGDGGVGLGKVDAFSLRVPFGDPSCLELADGFLFVSFDRVDPYTFDGLPRLGKLRELEDAVRLERRHLFVHRGLPVRGVFARDRLVERLWDGDLLAFLEVVDGWLVRKGKCNKVDVLDSGCCPRLLLRFVLLAVEFSILFLLLGLASWTSRLCPGQGGWCRHWRRSFEDGS
jgi:hypothetical protein